MKWPEGKWPYLFLTVVLLTLTHIFFPATAERMLVAIENGFRYVKELIPTVQG